ncbi:MAG TPA: elongation factor G, partial [Pirellulales bacterium]|nr:elongation factor G [Pirellulales bacterium]
KLSETLDMMKRQDPTFRAQESEETGQTLISGMGELHLEVIKNKLLRDFHLNVRVHKPRVSYRETIAKTVEVLGECHRIISGAQVNAELKLRIAPDEKSQAPGKVATGWFPQDEKMIKAAQVAKETLGEHAGGGGLFGFPLFNCTLTLWEISTPDPILSDVAVRIAAADAFNKALHDAEVVILEPIMKLEVSVPEEYLGDIVSDLQQRRAMITGSDHRGKQSLVFAEVPLAKMFGYSMAVRSLSQGRAGFSMEPFAYGPAPDEVRESFG